MNTILSNEKLLEWNRMGFIPGPNETEEEFIQRVEYGFSLHKTDLPLPEKSEKSTECLVEAFEKSKRLYDVDPKWIPVFFSNYQLSLWHGGCAWIFQVKEDSPTSALLQLRRVFRKSETFLGCYHRNEIVVHELAHVGRMMFEEPKFEEMLAYQSSHSRFRRWFGPIVQSSWESMFFVLMLFLIIVFDLFTFLMGHQEVYFTAMWLKLIPLGMLGIALLRLGMRHWRFRKCNQNLKEVLKVDSLARAVIYRLTDQEITLFSKISPKEILKYVKEGSANSLRWKVIDLAYFSNCVSF